ncbi:MAG TPA: hypothetical protein VNI60_06325 [Pyrinomonadaceae bacterium]|nr:hypothetical protein [Pyrinomonadaceae bacterium]
MATVKAKDSLHGLVRELYARTVTLTGKDKDVSEEFQTLRFACYDEAGNKIQEAYFNSDSSMFFKTAWTYDSMGKLVEQVNFDANESQTFKTVFEYDGDGRLVEKRTFGSDGSLESVLRPNYTAEGLRIEEETLPFSEDGDDVCCLIGIEETEMSFSAQGIHKIRKTYDGKGKPIDITLFNNKEKLTGKIFFAHNDNGKLIEIEHYGSSGFYPTGDITKWQRIFEPLITRLIKIFLFLKCIYSYGIRGELGKTARCSIYGPLAMLNVFVYDDKGRIVEEQTHFIGSIVMKKVFGYDEEGNKAEEIEYFNDDAVQRQSYNRKYDSHRNWIEETISSQFQTEEKHEQTTIFTYRTISYYSG